MECRGVCEALCGSKKRGVQIQKPSFMQPRTCVYLTTVQVNLLPLLLHVCVCVCRAKANKPAAL